MLASILMLTPSTTKGSFRLATSRRAILLPSSASAPISTIANSSPPSRTSKSEPRSALVSLAPSCRRTSSPAGWPNESLISLKCLRSTNINARRGSGIGVPASSAKNASRTWNRYRLFRRPVSSSVTDWRWRSWVSVRKPRTDRASRMPTATSAAVASPTATVST